jgi:hypothetical protein
VPKSHPKALVTHSALVCHSYRDLSIFTNFAIPVRGNFGFLVA